MMTDPDHRLPVKVQILANYQTNDWEVAIEFTSIPSREDAQRIVDLFREVLEGRDATAEFNVIN